MDMISSPLIGISADMERRSSGSTESEYFLRCNYAEAIIEEGGIPVILPYDTKHVVETVNRLDGIVFPGGMFDIHPRHYGRQPPYQALNMKETRTDFEMALMDAAIEKNMPVLGICNGMQLLAVMLGGRLIEDIGTDIDGCLEHLPFDPPTKASHEINIVTDSRLHQIAGTSISRVNSLHHQAVLDDGGVFVSARCCSDGVVEAIESSETPFCLGVQWHPEYKTSEIDQRIFQTFIRHAAKTKQQ